MPKSPCLVILGVAKNNGIWYNNKMSGSQMIMAIPVRRLIGLAVRRLETNG